jgi:hypothetical protein
LASNIDSLITIAERSIEVPLVKPNCNDDCISRTIQCHFRTRLHPATISIRGYNTSIQKRTWCHCL